MSNRRRAYPQPAYNPVPEQAYGLPPKQAANAFGGANINSPIPDYQQPQQQAQVDQLAQGVNAINLNNSFGQPGTPHTPQFQQFQQPQQPHYASQGSYQSSPMTPSLSNGAYQQADYSQRTPSGMNSMGMSNEVFEPSMMNKLYSTDLLKDLPAPIADLQFPPPPIILPNNVSATGSPDSNSSSEYFRSSLNVVPTSNSLLKKSKLPFALVVRPYISLTDDEKPVPTITDGCIARCRRCRSYINPYVQFKQDGRKWRCNFCMLLNDVPSRYNINPSNPLPLDRNELNYGVVEFVATADYMVRAPEALTYIFLLDVSKNSIQNGLLATVTRTILDSLDRIPNDNGRAQVSFMAVDNKLSYFSVPNDNEEDKDISMLIVSPSVGNENVLLPSPDGLLVNLLKSRKNIEKLLTNFTSYFITNQITDSALGPALKAAHTLIKNIGGKIIAITSTLPNVGEGKLTVRDESSVSDKQKEASSLLTANNSFYKSFAIECNKNQVSVDMFLTSSTYEDVATLSNLPKFTAGQTHFYPAWNANKMEDITKLSKELSNHLSMEIGMEAVMRIRGSDGLKLKTYYGNFFNRSSDLMSFPAFPRDQSYVIEVGLEDDIKRPVVFFQAAVLHTSSHGDRRIRVMTLALPTSKDLSEIYASADQLSITNYLTQAAIDKTLSSSLISAREFLIKSVTDILAMYKKDIMPGNIGSSSPLQISTNLRMLPLLVQALTKHIAFRSGQVPSDHRAAALNKLGSMPLKNLIQYIYPTIYSLHSMNDECGLPYEGEDDLYDIPPKKHGEIVLPESENATYASLERYGLYLINNSSEIFLYVGGDAVPQLLADVFGISAITELQLGKVELPELDNEFNIRVRNIINKIREVEGSIEYLSLYVVVGPASNEQMLTQVLGRELIPLRMWCLSGLVEDRAGNAFAYKDYLNQLREKITN